MDIISMAQQARPKPSGQMELLRAQFTTLSSCAKIMPSCARTFVRSPGLSSVTPGGRAWASVASRGEITGSPLVFTVTGLRKFPYQFRSASIDSGQQWLRYYFRTFGERA